MHGVCWEGVVPKARRRALVEVLFVVVRGRGGVTNVEERENDKRATPHGTLRVFGVSIGITCPVTRSSCGKQKDTSSATNTRQPTFLHFSSSTLHVHPLFRTKQNRLMLHQPHFLLTHTMKRVFVTTPRQLPICYASPPCPLPARLLWGSLLQRERTRDGIEACRV